MMMGSTEARISGLYSEIARQNTKIEQLHTALAWYADKENYDTGQDCPDILIDGGAIARRALGTNDDGATEPDSGPAALGIRKGE